MASRELLWTIQEERRRERAGIARERWAIASARARSMSLGSLVGWVRERLRALRPSRGWVAGGTSSG